MPNYQLAKVYKIWSPSKNIVYFGSTTQTLSRRLAKHKANYKEYNKDNSKYYGSVYLVLDCEDYKMELLEQYPCNNRAQLEKKEGEYIKNNECVNKNIAGRTIKEYKDDNAEKIKEYTTQYIIDNANKIKAYQKQYRLDNIDSIKKKAKQYRIDNIEKIKKK